MKNLVKILIVVCAVFFVSCKRDTLGSSYSGGSTSSTNSGSIQLSFTPEESFNLNSTSDTRATTEYVVENELLNLWILLFDENGDRIVPFVPEYDNNDQLINEFYDEEGILIHPSYDTNGDFIPFEPVFDESGTFSSEIYDSNGGRIILDYIINEDGSYTLKDQVNYTADGVTSERQGNTEDDEIYGSTYLGSYQSKDIIYVDKALSSRIRHIRAVANTITTWSYFTAYNCQTLNDYDEISFRLSNNAYRESDMWNTFDDICYLRMAGFWDGEIAETGLDFNIAILAKPIAAKVTVSYTCYDEEVTDGTSRAPSTIDVTSVQITRVPQNCYYRDVEDELEVHDHGDEYTSYQPRYVYDVDYLEDKTGDVSFYVPQNLKGTAGSSSDDIAEEDKDYSPESLKTLYHAQDATCVIITGLYKYWDATAMSMEKKYVYIQLYPGDNSYDNYDVKLRHEYHLNCTITAGADTVKWDTDYRVTLSEVLPEGAIVHYEFDPDNLTLNSAYDLYRDKLGDYPRENGMYGYAEYLDTERSPSRISANVNSYDDGVRTKTSSGYYYTGYTDDNDTYHEYNYDDAEVYDLNIDGLSDYYDRYFYGFSGTTNAIGTRYIEESTNTELIRPFLRNLAERNSDYDNLDGKNKFHRLRNHPDVFNCTLLKDNFKRYSSSNYSTLTSGYTSGVLKYVYPNNYIKSSFLQLSTGWGAGINPNKDEFTIVFIGSVGVNDAMGEKRGVYYGNSIDWNKRWYFYRIERSTAGNVTYGFGTAQTSPIDDLFADDFDNVQSYDICNNGSRKVYFNNVDVEAIQAETTVTSHYSKLEQAYDRPSTEDFIFDSPISIFGHTTVNNLDDAIDGKLRLFLIYDRVLDLDEIDQIRRYAALKGLLLYGVEDYDSFDVKVTNPSTETAWDSEIIWDDNNGEGYGDDATFGTAPSSN